MVLATRVAELQPPELLNVTSNIAPEPPLTVDTVTKLVAPGTTGVLFLYTGLVVITKLVI